MKFILVLFLLVGTLPDGFAQCDELKPMFGEKCVKTAAQRKADDKYVQAQVRKYGSADSAVRVLVGSSWQAFRNEKPAEAMKQLNRAWLLEKQVPDIYYLYGHLTRYAFAKTAAEAEKFYELGRLRDPNRTAEPRSLVKLVELMQDQHNLSGAIDASTQLVVSYPAYRQGYGYKQRAYLYTQAQELKRALEDADLALQLDPKDPDVFVARGFARSWKGDQEGAMADYNKALSLNPASGNAFRHRAMLYTDKLHQQELALTDIEKAIRLNPEELHNFKVKSDILFAMNRKNEACASLKNATRSGEKSITDAYKTRCGK